MNKLEQLYEGKAKKVFATDDPNLCIVSYKDDATAFNGQKKGTILGKGAINNRLTNYFMKLLEEKGIPTHFVEELNRSSPWRSSSAISPPAALPSASAWRRASSLSSPPSNSPTSAMSSTTLS